MHEELTPVPSREYEPDGHALQLAEDCAELVPAAHGVQAAGLPLVKPDTWAKPPLAAYEPAAHAPAH